MAHHSLLAKYQTTQGQGAKAGLGMLEKPQQHTNVQFHQIQVMPYIQV